MKKLLLLIAFFAIVIAARAQISGGLKAGFNLATFGNGAESKLKPGFHFGGYLNIGVSEKLNFQPELVLSMTGEKIDEKGPGFSYEYKTKLTYLTTPLSLQYSFESFTVHVGPQLSLLMRAKEEFTDTYTNTNGEVITESGEYDAKKFFKVFDLGLNFGAGISFGKWGASAGLSLGLLDIVKIEEAVEDATKLTNNVFQIAVMYKLFGKEKPNHIDW